MLPVAACLLFLRSPMATATMFFGFVGSTAIMGSPAALVASPRAGIPPIRESAPQECQTCRGKQQAQGDMRQYFHGYSGPASNGEGVGGRTQGRNGYAHEKAPPHNRILSTTRRRDSGALLGLLRHPICLPTAQSRA